MNNRRPWTFGDTLISLAAAVVSIPLAAAYMVLVGGNYVYVKVTGRRGLPS